MERSNKVEVGNKNEISANENWLLNNVANPFLNALALEPLKAIEDASNAASKHLTGKEWLPQVELQKVNKEAKPWSAEFFAQNMAVGLAMVVPYGVAGRLTAGSLRLASKAGVSRAGAQAAIKSQKVREVGANIIRSNKTGQILGAGIYDFAKEPEREKEKGGAGINSGESAPMAKERLANGGAGAASFAVYEAMNPLLHKSGIVGKLIEQSGLAKKLAVKAAGLFTIGAAGSVVGGTVRTGINEGRMSRPEEMQDGVLSGGVMNIALPVVQRGIGRGVNFANKKLGRGVSILDYAGQGDADIKDLPGGKELVNENTFGRIQPTENSTHSVDVKAELIKLGKGATEKDFAHGQLFEQQFAEFVESDGKQLPREDNALGAKSGVGEVELSTGDGEVLFSGEYATVKEAVEAAVAKKVSLKGVSLDNVNLWQANLAGADFKGARLEGAGFSGANVEGANFEGAIVNKALFNNVKAKGANFKGIQAERANFNYSALEGADFDGAQVNNALFQNVKAEGVNFKGLQAEGTNFYYSTLEGADFEGADFEGARLNAANFQGVKAKRANFKGIEAEGARFLEAEVEGADFEGARVNKADFNEAEAKEANFKGIDATDADFANANLERANFEEASVTDAWFKGVEAKRANFKGIRGKEPDFTNANLDGAHFEGARVEEASFEGVTAQRANFKGIDAEGANFQSAEIESADFEGAKIKDAWFGCVKAEGANFKGIQAEGANFDYSVLYGAHFEGARVEGASFEGVTAEGANFKGIEAEGVNFQSAEIESADFEGAKIKDASFEHVDAESANFKGIDAKGAGFWKANLEWTNFEGA